MATIEQQRPSTSTSHTAASLPPNNTNKANKKRANKADANKVDANNADANNADANKVDAATGVDHPYLSFLYKRIRLYKKKLEKIKALEVAQQSDGKTLNDQQLELVGSRPVVEKMLVEFEALREQFVGVFLEEQAAKPASLEPQQSEDNAATEASQPVAINEEPQSNFMHVEDLLRTLHAVTLHQALGKDVPMVLDYFSKVLLGKTRPPAEVSFEENLAESMEEAKRYLSHSDKVMACDTTYRDLRAVIDDLSASLSAVKTKEASEVVAAPEINFFSESHAVLTTTSTVPRDAEGETASTSEGSQAPPSPPAELVPPPPKSFSSGPSSPSVNSSEDADPTQSSPQQQQHQHRRHQGRWKANKPQFRVKEGSDSGNDRPRSAAGRKDDNRRPPRSLRKPVREESSSHVAPPTA
ncbi:hypothetical protein ATCC90586_010864 [Pythium insidiosum]|nr:hypothetical protein ATCC90586_010864 [Pythium insidiosum]